MIFELIGARMLGPYAGTSLFVWTSLIGIILGSLSLGYWLGGKIADIRPDYTYFGLIILLAGLSILITAQIQSYLLNLLSSKFFDIRVLSLVASVILFLPGSLFLGMVSPYAVKLKLKSITTSGSVVGNLYAISTIGSITGTFLAGFYLIPYFGVSQLVFLISLLLIFIAAVLFATQKKWFALGFGILTIIVAWFLMQDRLQQVENLVDVDTQYNRVTILETTDYYTLRPIRMLKINDEHSSAIFLDSEELVFNYLKFYHLFSHFVPDFDHVLMIGGSGYTYPMDFLKRYPGAKIDVVEIDPKLTELAMEYFRLEPDPALKIIHEDGRIFFNNNSMKYDAILMDAYKAQFSVPYQLTTRECILKQYESLQPCGVVIANIITALDPDNSIFLQAQLKTYQSIFPIVRCFAMNDPQNMDVLQNIMVVAFKEGHIHDYVSYDSLFNTYLQKEVFIGIDDEIPILTDDYAPVEYYTTQTMHKYYSQF
nr:fused MFS/spermidine synthase [Bacteroidota bacterium]